MTISSSLMGPLGSYVCVLNLALLTRPSSADYCEFGFCESEDYCCGNNKCCTKSLDLWVFWAGVVLVLFVLAIAAGLRYSRKNRPTYILLSTQPIDPKADQLTSVAFKS